MHPDYDLLLPVYNFRLISHHSLLTRCYILTSYANDLLLTTFYLLLATYDQQPTTVYYDVLFATNHLLQILTRHSRLTAHYPLLTSCYLLPTNDYLLLYTC
jgi:hypothetical protein